MVGLYDHFEDAQKAVSDLASAGFPREDISLIADDKNGKYKEYLKDTGTDKDRGNEAGKGAGIGAGSLCLR